MSPRFGAFDNLLTRIRAENVIFTHVFRTDPEISVDFARAVDKQMPHLRHIALYAVDLAFGQKEVLAQTELPKLAPIRRSFLRSWSPSLRT